MRRPHQFYKGSTGKNVYAPQDQGAGEEQTQGPAPEGGTTNSPSSERQASTKPDSGLLSQLFGQFVFSDIASSVNHSSDFCGSRAEYITIRLRILALTIGLFTPTWLIVDYLTLHGSDFAVMAGLRIGAAAPFLALGLSASNPYSLQVARLRLIAFISIGSVFYLATRLTLDGSMTAEGILSGYTFLPYLLAAVLAVFPLTLLEGLGLAALPTLAVAIADFSFGTLPTVEAAGIFWLMALLIGIALTAGLSQLQMLLRLYRQATRDPLTGLFNRRALMERLDSEISRSRRYGRKLSVLLFDLDHFKRINDQFGHLTGDAVLVKMADLLTAELRASDVVGRYGGEEFLAVLPETTREGAKDVAERIQTKCELSTASGPQGKTVLFTTSIGVAELDDQDDADTLFKRVDYCLYRAKGEGRNCVVTDG